MACAGWLRQVTVGCRCVRISRAGCTQSPRARRFCQDGRDLREAPPGGVTAASPGPLGATGRVSSDPMDMKSNPT